jgi:hypothetical protein
MGSNGEQPPKPWVQTPLIRSAALSLEAGWYLCSLPPSTQVPTNSTQQHLPQARNPATIGLLQVPRHRQPDVQSPALAPPGQARPLLLQLRGERGPGVRHGCYGVAQTGHDRGPDEHVRAHGAEAEGARRRCRAAWHALE